MREIVKVQVPLNGEGPALIYNKDRRRTATKDRLPEHVVKAMGGSFKAFFFAQRSRTGWVLEGPAPDQEW